MQEAVSSTRHRSELADLGLSRSEILGSLALTCGSFLTRKDTAFRYVFIRRPGFKKPVHDKANCYKNLSSRRVAGSSVGSDCLKSMLTRKPRLLPLQRKEKLKKSNGTRDRRQGGCLPEQTTRCIMGLTCQGNMSFSGKLAPVFDGAVGRRRAFLRWEKVLMGNTGLVRERRLEQDQCEAINLAKEAGHSRVKLPLLRMLLQSPAYLQD